MSILSELSEKLGALLQAAHKQPTHIQDEFCPRCRQHMFKVSRIMPAPDFGDAAQHRLYECHACGYTEMKMFY